MLKIRNVLSLFDGISCGQVALERAGINYENYYASEIDKYSIQVTQKNYPNTIQLGDINDWKKWEIDWSSIDLVMGGSPCQGFSNAGKGLNFDDPRSKLFFVFVDILNHIKKLNPNVKFLLENVRMKKEWQNLISKFMGVEPVFINSALVSAQNRQRLYWTNLGHIEQPEDKGILLKDILLTNAIRIPSYGSEEKSRPLTSHYSNNFGGWYARICDPNPSKQQIDILAKSVNKPICVNSQSGSRDGKRKQHSLADRIYDISGKMVAVTSSFQPNIADPIYYTEIGSQKNVFEVKNNKIIIYGKEYEVKLPNGFYMFRKLTPVECERLQTLPDNYTDGVSNSQRYKAIGNGWTVDVIVHILKGLKEYLCITN